MLASKVVVDNDVSILGGPIWMENCCCCCCGCFIPAGTRTPPPDFGSNLGWATTLLVSDVKVALLAAVDEAVVAIPPPPPVEMKLGAILSGMCRMAADCGDGIPLSLEGNGITAAPRLVAVIGLICGDPEDRARNVGEERESDDDDGEKEDCVVTATHVTGPVVDVLTAEESVAGLRISEPLRLDGDDLTIAVEAIGEAEEEWTTVAEAAGRPVGVVFAFSWALVTPVAFVADTAGPFTLTSACSLAELAGALSRLCSVVPIFSRRGTLFFLAESVGSGFFRLASLSLSAGSLGVVWLAGGSPGLFSGSFLICLLTSAPSVSTSASTQVTHRHFLVCGFNTPEN